MRRDALQSLLLVLLLSVSAQPHAAAPDATPTAAAAPSAAAPAVESRVALLTAPQVIQILDDTVEWYRTLGTQQQNASQPSDLLILFANRQTADKVVELGFQIARANAELLSSEASTTSSTADAASPQGISQQEQQLQARRQAIERELATDRQAASPAARSSELRGELAMVGARLNLLDTISQFVSQGDTKGAGANALKAQIDAIAASLPSASAATPTAPVIGAAAAHPLSTVAPVTALGDTEPVRSGIWDLGSAVLKLRGKIATIDLIDRHTSALGQTFKKLGEPSLKQLQAYSARSDALASEADHAAGAALQDLRSQFDTLAWLFQQTSAIVLPLAEEQVLLQQYRRNLSSWRETTLRQYHEAWAALGVRLGILAGALAVLYGLGVLWQRAVLRYAHDPRRRYQLLLVRKIVLWIVAAVIVGLSFVSEISSFATFAGLLTAGVAVAMQSVLVSVVGYFFLIGKYGIRVGDRIQIGNVVGEVIDLGLVRMQLMELNQNGPLGPTGRVVAFANLIVFQASGGLFKQIPGVNLSWHEITLKLPLVSDYPLLKRRLLAAVSEAAGEFHEEILRQTKEIARSTQTSSANDTIAQVQMHLADGQMQALIRYPVHFEHALDADERVSEAILKVISESAP